MCGLMEVQLLGKKHYFCILVDDRSQFLWFQPCALKSDFTPWFIKLNMMFVSGERPVPVQPRSVSTGINPLRRGPASLEAPLSLLSQRPKRSVGTLQGLTCEKKTESILVKAANLYSK